MADEIHSQILAQFGERLFGDEWGAPMARLTGVNERTVQRIRTAAKEGREYPAARGVLAALAEAVEEVGAQLRQWRR